MIYKLVGLDQNELYKKIGNMLNKVAESLDAKEKENVELVSHLQPDDSRQDRRLLDDAFKFAVKRAVRAMAPYVDNSVSDIKLTPPYLTLQPNADSSAMINVTANSSWTLSVSDTTEHVGYTFAIPLKFPNTWLDVDTIQQNVEDYVTSLMIARYLENVDKRLAQVK